MMDTHNELVRLGSYIQHGSSLLGREDVSLAKLSRAGFYSVGPREDSACYECGLTVNKWPPNPDPFKIHRERKSDCPHLVRTDSVWSDVHGPGPPADSSNAQQNSSQPQLLETNTQQHSSDPSISSPNLENGTSGRNGHVSSQELDPTVYDSMMPQDVCNGLQTMGYSQEFIKRAKKYRWGETGTPFPSLESVFDCIDQLEKEEEAEKGSAGNEASGYTPPNQPNNVPSNRNDHPPNNDELDPTRLTEDELKDIIHQMSTENEQLRDKDLCVVCMDEKVSVVLLKCGHLVCCSPCASNVHKCPVCRQVIRGTVRVMPLVKGTM